MVLRDFLLFVVTFGLLYSCSGLLPIVYEAFEKSSAFFIGAFVTYWVAKTLKKTFFNQKLSPENKAIFITGCDSGFGYELAKRMDLLGYGVFAGCFYPKGEGAINLANTCSSNVQILPLDVTNDRSVEEAKVYVTEHLNSRVLWAVVNNAGVPQAGEIDWTSMEEIQAVCNVNTFGTVRVTKAFLPLLKKSKGRVVNTTSSVGRFICPGFVGYCMSKSAAIAFTEGIRIELLKWGIEAISIEPFFYKTPLTTKERATESAVSTWNKADADTKREYGDRYLESFKKNCNHTVKLSSAKLYQVIDCFEDAITAAEPQSVYFPAYLPHKLGILVLGMLPPIFKEGYMRLMMGQVAKPASLIKERKE